jgi:uncharacterized membrane protein (TIGR02234 family)
MSSFRSRTLALGGLLAGSAGAFIAGTQPWWRAIGQGLDVAFSGNSSTGGISQALALVGLAGALLMLVLAARGRRLVAAILALAGAGMAVVGALRSRPSATAVRTQVRTVSLSDQFTLAATPWPWVYAVAGAVVLLSAAATLASAGGWPQRAGRYGMAQAGVRNEQLLEHPADAWRAQDEGLDPTEDAAERAVDPFHPDVHSGPGGDTMGGTQPSAKSPSAE